MKIKQYNFIRGASCSGKTLFARKMVSILKIPTIYYNLDKPSIIWGEENVNDLEIITIGNPTFGEILKSINIISENLYEMRNIVIDPITNIPNNGGHFDEFINSLPKNHRYFLITGNSHIKPGEKTIDDRNDTISYYMNSFLIPENSISVFDTYKTSSEISVYNYNSNEMSILGHPSQISRDIKINEVLR